MKTPREAFLLGIRDEFPLILGVIPFGMIYGVLALAAGIPASIAQLMSSVVFAGSSQFIAVSLIAGNTPLWTVILTIFVVNLRHGLYSISLAPYVQKLPERWKMGLAYLLTDEAYAVTIQRYRQSARNDYTHWFFLGAGLTLWLSWQLSTALGIFLGAQIPANWSLDFTLALTFIAIVVPTLKDKPAAAAALSAGLCAIAGHTLPYKTGLFIAALIGVGVGLWSEARWKPSG